MNVRFPTVTVIIPARPDQTEIKAVAGSRALDYPPEKLEIIVARGKQPSVQRNAALRAATGDLVYFLDDDSVPGAKNLQHVIGHFQDEDVKMVGGPNVCPPDAPGIEQVFALVLSSWAMGPSRARYTPVGTIRETSEKELILCNLVSRRKDLLQLGGFNEKLYPNEENALMDQLQADGGRLLYDSGMIVHRRPRPHMKAFGKMLMTYGRGRAEQFRVHPTLGSALNFAPPLFLVYLILLPILCSLKPHFTGLACLPLVAYTFGVVIQGLMLTRLGEVRHALATIPLMFLVHILYGFGFWRGLFTKLKPPSPERNSEVVLETLTL